MQDWRAVWYAMADGDSTQYNHIKAMEIREYFSYYDEWKKRIEMKLNALNKNK